MEKKLTLEHLAPYLPYGLKVKHFDAERNNTTICRIEQIHLPEEITLVNSYYEHHECIADITPILRPLSDLFSDELNPVPINGMRGYYGWDYLWLDVHKNKEAFNVHALKWACLNIMLKHHFDVFGLIEAGLAIDINTLTPNK